MRGIFLRDGQTKIFEGKEMRIDWPNPQSKRKTSPQAWLKMKLFNQLVQSEFNESHKSFLDLLEFMMKLDPKERPTAREALDHPFFSLKIAEID